MILRAKTSVYLKSTSKAIFWTPLASFVFGFSAPKIGGAPPKTFSKGSFTRFFPKKTPGGGAFYQISPDVALLAYNFTQNVPKKHFFGLH